MSYYSVVPIVANGYEEKNEKAHKLMAQARTEEEFESAAYAIARTHGCGCYCTYCCM